MDGNTATASHPNAHPWRQLESSLKSLLGITPEGDREIAAAQIRGFAVQSAAKNFSSKRLRSADCDPEAVAHDFLAAMLERGLRGYDPAKGPLYAYWYAALCRLCIDVARHAVRRRAGSLSMDVVDRRPSPQAIAARRELQERVTAAVQQLPKGERVPLKLTYRRGRTMQAISHRCGLKKSTVTVRIHRGRSRLRVLLAPAYRAHFRAIDAE